MRLIGTGKARPATMLVLILICVVTFLDQLTKILVTQRIAHYETVPVIPGLFNLAHVHNTGAAFSMFHDSNVPLAVFSAAVLAILLLFRSRFLAGPAVHRFAIAMVAAGIIGNLMDRLKYASVVDILDFYSGGYHFPTFNIADASICIGVAIYVLSTFFERRGGGAPAGSVGAGTAAKAGTEPQLGNAAARPSGQLEANNDSSLHGA